MAREISWSDDTIQPRSNTEFSERSFSLEAGREDRIRILSNPVVFKRHWVAENRRYVNCLESAKCPACARGYAASESFACLVLHIASSKTGKTQIVGLTKVWMFGDANKYIAIKEMRENYAPEKILSKLELRITCQETKFQKLGGMYPVMDVSKKLYDKTMLDDIKNNKDLLKKFVEPRSAKDIEDALNASPEDGGDDTAVAEELGEELEQSTKLKNVQQKKVLPKAKVQEESVEEDIESEIDKLLE